MLIVHTAVCGILQRVLCDWCQSGLVLVCSNLVAKINALCEYMLHAPVQREDLVAAAEGLLKGEV